jgi:hypothetical protein
MYSCSTRFSLLAIVIVLVLASCIPESGVTPRTGATREAPAQAELRLRPGLQHRATASSSPELFPLQRRAGWQMAHRTGDVPIG